LSHSSFKQHNLQATQAHNTEPDTRTPKWHTSWSLSPGTGSSERNLWWGIHPTSTAIMHTYYYPSLHAQTPPTAPEPASACSATAAAAAAVLIAQTLSLLLS
jgi:hypothetical protein